MFTHDFVGNFTLIKTKWPCQTVIRCVVANRPWARYHKADIFYVFASSCSFLLKPEFPWRNQKKRRLITAAYLSSELSDLRLHTCKDMDKSSATWMQKSNLGFRIYSLYAFLKYFSSQNVPSPKKNLKRKEKHFTGRLSSFILPTSALWRCKHSFLSQPVVQTKHLGAALQPLSTNTDPELLRRVPVGQA